MNKPIRTACRICGKPILLVETTKGKRLPVDIEMRDFVIGDTPHTRRFVTEDGDILRGELAGDGEKDHDRITGMPCHFDSCKGGQK